MFEPYTDNARLTTRVFAEAGVSLPDLRREIEQLARPRSEAILRT